MKNAVRLWIPLLTLLWTLQSQSKTTEVIFFIHGYGGDDKTFCDLPDLLQKRLSSEDKQIITKSLFYSTKQDDLSPAEFVNEVKSQISEYYRQNNLNTDTPYHFVVHSQGGIVALKFIEKCVKRDCEGAPTPKNIKTLVTLGTPFWGSPTAFKLKDMALVKSLGILPLAQLRELSFGSLSLTTNRKSLLRFKPDGSLVSPFPQGMKIYNLGGDINRVPIGFFSNMFLSSFGLRLPEFDLVVDYSSSNLDFNYHIEGASKDDRVLTGRTQFSTLSIPLRAVHVPTLGMQGIACYENSILSGPAKTVDLIEKMLAHKINIRETAKKISKKARNFAVEIKFYLPLGYQRKLAVDDGNMRVSYDKKTLKLSNDDADFLNKFFGFNKDFDNAAAKTYHSFVHTGRVLDDSDEQTITYTVQVPGWQEKVVSLKVNPGFTTYAEVYLKPDLPLSARSVEKEGTCFIAQVGEALGVNQAHLFRDFLDKKPFTKLEEGDTIEIMARQCQGLYSGQSDSCETDRYRARLMGTKNPHLDDSFWINVSDVDILKRCD